MIQGRRSHVGLLCSTASIYPYIYDMNRRMSMWQVLHLHHQCLEQQVYFTVPHRLLQTP